MTRAARAPLFDDEFLELTMEDVKENVLAVAKSRAKKPRPQITQLHVATARGYHRINITVERVT